VVKCFARHYFLTNRTSIQYEAGLFHTITPEGGQFKYHTETSPSTSQTRGIFIPAAASYA
jgi:hypothetical protein